VRALVVATPPPGRIEFVTDWPAPRAAAGEVLLGVRLAGICATDLEIARGYMQFHGVLGHEFVGTVMEGPAHLAGRRVVAEINCACGECDTCRRGEANHCPRRTVLGIAGRDGAFAEYVAVPEANCHRVPDAITDRQAVFVEPLAAAAHVLDECPLAAEMRVAVLGSGRLGLLVAQVLATTACQLTVIGRNAATLAFCQQRGLRTLRSDALPADAQYDVVVECTGAPAGLKLALRLCRPRGMIVLKSTYAEPAPVDLAPAVINEVRIVGSRCGDFVRALHLLESGQVQVADLVSASFPLARGVEALEAAGRPENIKVLLEIAVHG
jgi:2-desacetyl-2-hydroxyethyl bacteriochlorophyllide A dehydrogenase